MSLRWRLADEEDESKLFGDGSLLDRHIGRGAYRGIEFLHVNARSVLNRVPAASRMPFRYTVNVYRGCSHACTYCFARPTHTYLGLDMAEDFERRIVVKVNAVERLARELGSGRFDGEHVAMGTNTDPYQKAEGKYHLTRGVIGVLADRAQPFSILTKSTLVLRDLGLLAAAARQGEVSINLSVGTVDKEIWRLTEPGTPPPEKRLEAVRRLNEAGVPCGVLVAPLLPGLSDSEEQLEAIGAACAEAGARSVTTILLHLRPGVREHYLGWLASMRPDLVAWHEQRYANRAYLPDAEQHRVASTVRGAFGSPDREAPSWRMRGQAPAAPASKVDDDRTSSGPTRGTRPATPRRTEQPGPEQLRLC